jgi:hypothetical protein
LVQFPKAELETLWAPWRFEYFEKSPTPDFLSEAARASDDDAHLVLVRRKNSFLIMNRYPYTIGHLMAVPYRKVGELRDLGENEVAELFSLVVRGQELLRQPRGSTSGSTSANALERACPITCIFTSYRVGVATRISCQCFQGRACSHKDCTISIKN